MSQRSFAFKDLPFHSSQGHLHSPKETQVFRGWFVMTRWLSASALALILYTGTQAAEPSQQDVQAKIDSAHAEMWKRFVDEYNLVVDYTDLDGKLPRPTPEECKAGKPNALAWWTPTENAGMFNGTYMDAMTQRWLQTKSEEDKAKAQRLSKGLLLIASVSPVKGFIARNVATDGKTPYPMGSNDQTAPWFYGLWRYLSTPGLASPEEREQIIAKMTEVTEALEAAAWRMPCNEGAPSPYRGTFAGIGWEFAPRLLFVLKAMHQLTGDERWAKQYEAALKEYSPVSGKTRLDVCRIGMLFEHEKRHSWTCASGLICLRGLWELETNPERKTAYAQGLSASAKLASTSLSLHADFKLGDNKAFLADWRVLNEWWKPQNSEQEAVDLAKLQVKELGKRSPRRHQEFTFVREPAYAAWIITMCPDAELVKQHQPAIHQVLAHYDYTKLYYSQFFPVEAAWYRLQQLK